MLIKIDLDPSVVKKIEQLIVQGTYSDIRQFVNISISNQLEEEISTVMGSKSSRNKLSSGSGPSKLSTESRDDVRNLAYQVTSPFAITWRRHLQDMQIEDTEIQPTTSNFIWYFYNRFFPVKVVIHQLAQIMVTQQKNWIDLADLQVQAFEYAEEVATKLKNIEISAKMARNKKLSTGLPASRMELIGLQGTVKRRKEDKQQRGKTRFMNQIVGRYIPKERTFTGACFELGLIAIQQRDENSYVSLTELGKEFALLENPILDKELFESSFSDKEVYFIFHRIYSRFGLESKLVNEILERLKKEPLTSSQIDEVFKKENRKSFTVERIATMGRLSELQIVNWEIDSEGKSKYSLNQEKFQLLD